MLLTLMKSKLHRATVTQADLDYEGSIAIDRDLLDASGILPHEQVDVLNLHNENSPASETGDLTENQISGLGMGPDQTIAGQPFAGGISYANLEALNIDLGSGDAKQHIEDFPGKLLPRRGRLVEGRETGGDLRLRRHRGCRQRRGRWTARLEAQPGGLRRPRPREGPPARA